MSTRLTSSKIILLAVLLFAFAPTAKAEQSGCPMLQHAAEQGDPDRQLLYARALDNGYCGFKIDKEKAAYWYKKSAEQGNVSAQSALGIAYFFGNGVEQDDKEAFKWLLKAGDRGNADAQYTLSLYYDRDRDLVSDVKAAKWLQKAADQGLRDAQMHLAYRYRDGIGVEKDDREAYFWFYISAKSGSIISSVERDLVAAKLTPQQFVELNKRADNWKPQSR